MTPDNPTAQVPTSVKVRQVSWVGRARGWDPGCAEWIGSQVSCGGSTKCLIHEYPIKSLSQNVVQDGAPLVTLLLAAMEEAAGLHATLWGGDLNGNSTLLTSRQQSGESAWSVTTYRDPIQRGKNWGSAALHRQKTKEWDKSINSFKWWFPQKFGEWVLLWQVALVWWCTDDISCPKSLIPPIHFCRGNASMTLILQILFIVF